MDKGRRLAAVAIMLLAMLVASCANAPTPTDSPGIGGMASEVPAPVFAPPIGPGQRPAVRAREATPDEKAVFAQERRSAKGRLPPPRSKPVTRGDDWALCLVSPLHCLLAAAFLVAVAPLAVATLVANDSAEIMAAVRKAESYVQAAPFDLMLVRATEERQARALPISDRTVIEYRIVGTEFVPWDPREHIKGTCLRASVDMAVVDGDRIVWREAFVIGGAGASLDAWDVACWEVGANIPTTEERLQQALAQIAEEVAKALERRTPGLGWITTATGNDSRTQQPDGGP